MRSSLGIATVYQELSLLPNLTVAQNIALGREPRRGGLLDAAAMRDVARTALERLGLDIAPDAPVVGLSLAERQMVEIAKALAADPSVLVLDEPTAPLGRARGRAAVRHLRRLAARAWRSSMSRIVSARCSTFATGRRCCATAAGGDDGRACRLERGRLTEAMVGAAANLCARRRPPAGDVR